MKKYGLNNLGLGFFLFSVFLFLIFPALCYLAGLIAGRSDLKLFAWLYLRTPGILMGYTEEGLLQNMIPQPSDWALPVSIAFYIIASFLMSWCLGNLAGGGNDGD